jgi:UDP-GlcNAc3NAcA epimerase
MKLLTILGARPQFIKAAAVSREIYKNKNIKEVIIHTGQHYDFNMSDIFFKEMDIPKPDYNLNINGMLHGAMTGQMLEEIEKLIVKEKPECVLVYGDTNSTLAGSLAASKLHVPVAHVEAGLRSFNMKMPEEINRILTDRISKYLFCPTDQAVTNLKDEGFDKFDCKVVKTGDVMQDAAMFYAKESFKKSNVIKDNNLNKFILVTIHRAENTDNKEKLKSIFKAFLEISKDIEVVIPMHPRTRNILKNISLDTNDLKIINPVGYFDMIELLKNCSLVMTDSGGLQKEAFFFEKPCVTLREETEWVELVDNGYNMLAGSSKEKIISIYKKMINKTIPENVNLYGGGFASKNIVENLIV